MKALRKIKRYPLNYLEKKKILFFIKFVLLFNIEIIFNSRFWDFGCLAVLFVNCKLY